MRKKRLKGSPESKWTNPELKKVESSVRRIKKHERFFSQIVFWSAILVVVIGNLLISVALIPFLAVLNRWFLDLIIVLLGLVIGILFSFLINDIGHLDKHHHVLAGIILPILALVNVIFVVLIANQMIDTLEIINVRHNPWVIGIMYGVAFISPYVISRVRQTLVPLKGYCSTF